MTIEFEVRQNIHSWVQFKKSKTVAAAKSQPRKVVEENIPPMIKEEYLYVVEIMDIDQNKMLVLNKMSMYYVLYQLFMTSKV